MDGDGVDTQRAQGGEGGAAVVPVLALAPPADAALEARGQAWRGPRTGGDGQALDDLLGGPGRRGAHGLAVPALGQGAQRRQRVRPAQRGEAARGLQDGEGIAMAQAAPQDALRFRGASGRGAGQEPGAERGVVVPRGVQEPGRGFDEAWIVAISLLPRDLGAVGQRDQPRAAAPALTRACGSFVERAELSGQGRDIGSAAGARPVRADRQRGGQEQERDHGAGAHRDHISRGRNRPGNLLFGSPGRVRSAYGAANIRSSWSSNLPVVQDAAEPW